MVGLFECTVPEADCNIHLGSRRKSRAVQIPLHEVEYTREELPAHVTAWVLKSIQHGRPDRLLHKEVLQAVGKVCVRVVDELLAKGTEKVSRMEAFSHVNEALDNSNIPIPIRQHTDRWLESFTAQCLGTCEDQEDRSIRCPSLAAFVGVKDEDKDEEVDYCIGVMDGHAGNECSEFSHDRLFYEVGKQGLHGDVESILSSAYRTTDTAFAKKADELELKAGCTALLCLVRGDMLWVANVGDSRGILCSRQSHKVLTTDHNVKNPDEVKEVLARGGTIMRNRVNGVLCVTRALGNRTCRDLISQTPDIASYTIDWDDDVFVVIGSDGLYDNCTNEEICNYIMTRKNRIDADLAALRESHPIQASPNPTPLPLTVAEKYLQCTYQACADSLIEYVRGKKTGYCDNTTCVILFLDTKQCINSIELHEAARIVNASLEDGKGEASMHAMNFNASINLCASLHPTSNAPMPSIEKRRSLKESSMLGSSVAAPPPKAPAPAGNFLGSDAFGDDDDDDDALDGGDGFDMMASSVMGRPPPLRR
eukprot:TRINITY_DN25329_c0_g1_i1.p1 TRINITY_DN25329_c0_g1~~TRINITY_DN25329_c0_g1_i1.p1  ORF type:complete len:537 (+),score=151.93 TRINITY_DN25329_c0_g1_i1:134-1744(+)